MHPHRDKSGFGHTRRAGKAAVLAGALLLLLACVVAPPFAAAVATSSYTTTQKSNTLAFLQGFATAAWGLETAWAGTDFCTWTYVTCSYSYVTVALETLTPTNSIALPEVAAAVDGSSVMVGRFSAQALGSALSGTLPTSWSRLTRLTQVALPGNTLSGMLPAEWASLTALTVLNVSGNALTGPLPVEWGALRTLSTLDLSSNQLSGSLPGEWRTMYSLSTLLVNNNQLSGTVPTALSDRYVSVVDISGNAFCGCAPKSWNSSTIKFTADPALRAANCMMGNTCPGVEYPSPAQNATQQFLQGFAVSMPGLQGLWANQQYCSLAGVACIGETVTLDLSDVALSSRGSLPELAAGVDGSLVSVTQVRIAGRGSLLAGTLPASWGRLTQLTEVTLAGDALTGTLPLEWSSITYLQTLNLSANQLSGPLPPQWSSLRSLSYLSVKDNQLSGSVPSILGSMYVKTVDLSQNAFCGCAPGGWNSSFMTTLTADPALRATNCVTANACAVDESSTPAQKATLKFLQGFAVSMPALQTQWADTRYCAFAGVTCNTETVTLDLSAVTLSTAGSLPELAADVNGSLVAVTRMQMANRGGLITGAVPASWGRLSQLAELLLQGNRLSGTLPAAWGSLKALSVLNVAGNAVTGPLPTEWGALKALSKLDLRGNALTSKLPAEWGSLSHLSFLYLQQNELSGSVPTEWRAMGYLSVLNLSDNKLTGTIPEALSDLDLISADVSGNQFCGCVPSGWNSSYYLQLRVEPALRAADCATASVCVPTTTTTTTTSEAPSPTTTEAPPTTTAAPAKSGGSNLTALWTVIGAVGGCLLVAAVVLLVLWWRRRAAAAAAAAATKKPNRTDRAPDTASSEPYGESEVSL